MLLAGIGERWLDTYLEINPSNILNKLLLFMLIKLK